MDWEALVNVAMNNGMAIVVTLYFLYRDWKFNSTLLETMTSLKETVTNLNQTVYRLHNGEK